MSRGVQKSGKRILYMQTQDNVAKALGVKQKKISNLLSNSKKFKSISTVKQ
jgi:plasmid maintenance system antidote protein VapI